MKLMNLEKLLVTKILLKKYYQWYFKFNIRKSFQFEKLKFELKFEAMLNFIPFMEYIINPFMDYFIHINYSMLLFWTLYVTISICQYINMSHYMSIIHDAITMHYKCTIINIIIFIFNNTCKSILS